MLDLPVSSWVTPLWTLETRASSALSLAKANLYPKGIDSRSGIATGRFCNSRTVADVVCTCKPESSSQTSLRLSFCLYWYLTSMQEILLMIISWRMFIAWIQTIFEVLAVEKLGAPIPQPHLKPMTHCSVLLNGVNYASGAGGILDSTGSNDVRVVKWRWKLFPHILKLKSIFWISLVAVFQSVGKCLIHGIILRYLVVLICRLSRCHSTPNWLISRGQWQI